MNENTSNSLWNWFPVAIEQHDASLFLDWRFVADRRFTEPFFLDTLASIPLDQRLSCRTSPEVLAQFDGLDCLEPSGFIFHSSRCGSTLISQLLATSNECIVISEAPVIDSALNLYHQETFDLHAPGILKGILRAFGQRRNGDEKHLFVKLDSWHIGHLPRIRQLFPRAQLFFVYRHPAEILLSHVKQRGQQMVPGQLDPDFLGIESQRIDAADLNGYCMKVVASFFRSAIRHAESGHLWLINYTQLPELIWTQFAQMFSISQNDDAIQLMRQRSLRHSKQTVEPFTVEKGHDANQSEYDGISDAEQYYNALEQLRLNQDSW